tara:strand:- start:281 stop:1324 length:1044 start_codon:yes stop_codon:yes gene_type:complete
MRLPDLSLLAHTGNPAGAPAGNPAGAPDAETHYIDVLKYYFPLPLTTREWRFEEPAAVPVEVSNLIFTSEMKEKILSELPMAARPENKDGWISSRWMDLRNSDRDFVQRLGKWISDHYEDPDLDVPVFLTGLQHGPFYDKKEHRTMLYITVLLDDGNRIATFRGINKEWPTPGVVVAALTTGGDSLTFVREKVDKMMLFLMERDLETKYPGFKEGETLELLAAKSSVQYAFITLFRLDKIVNAPGFDATSNREWVSKLTLDIATSFSSGVYPGTRNIPRKFVDMLVELCEDTYALVNNPTLDKEERERKYEDDMQQGTKRARVSSALEMATDVHDRHVRGDAQVAFE